MRVKVVPASRDTRVVGVLGDRLKVRVAAPPEGGKANAAVCEVLAGALGLPRRAVTVLSGHGHAEKVVRVEGLGAAAVEAGLT